MSSNYHVYVGPYVKVNVPDVIKENLVRSCPTKSCPRHGKIILTSFCPECGSKIEGVTFLMSHSVDLQGLLETYLQDLDLFQVVRLEDKVECYLPNRRDQGGINLHHEDGKETPIPDLNFTHPDWDRLTKMLDEQKISYEKKSGIIEWWY